MKGNALLIRTGQAPAVEAKQHNYSRGLEELLTSGAFDGLQKGGVYRLEVRHGEACGLFAGGVCDCQPAFSLAEAG